MSGSRSGVSSVVFTAVTVLLVIVAGIGYGLYGTQAPRSITSTISVQQNPVQLLARVNVPITIPLSHGFAKSSDVFFITTEASDSALAQSLSSETGFKVSFAPLIAKAPQSALSVIYVFTNGLKGDGYLGFQSEVFDSAPGDSNYSPAWKVTQVTWNSGSTPTLLKSTQDISTAQAASQLSVKDTGAVVNCPIVKWAGGSLPLETQPVTDQTAYGSAQVLSIDTNAMKVTFRAHRGWGPDGHTIYYIVTDVSDKDAAKGLGITYAPKLQNLSGTGALSPLYQFANGISGSGPLGFQAGIGATVPGQDAYSPFWSIQAISWKDPAKAVILESVTDIGAVRDSITIQAGPVVNCPFLTLP
jgi:hypothetical protein